jgi:hypothetical protein
VRDLPLHAGACSLQTKVVTSTHTLQHATASGALLHLLSGSCTLQYRCKLLPDEQHKAPAGTLLHPAAVHTTSILQQAAIAYAFVPAAA